VHHHLAVGGGAEDLKMAPRPSSSARTAREFTRFPLWARATGPPSVFAQKGWAFRSRLPPEVE
jgi:hypothetical protein